MVDGGGGIRDGVYVEEMEAWDAGMTMICAKGDMGLRLVGRGKGRC